MSTTLNLIIPADHPSLAGHFPGQPIVPGVVLLDQTQSLFEQSFSHIVCGLSVAKFLSPVRPGEALSVELDENGRFEIRASDRKIANGRFTLCSKDTA